MRLKLTKYHAVLVGLISVVILFWVFLGFGYLEAKNHAAGTLGSGVLLEHWKPVPEEKLRLESTDGLVSKFETTATFLASTTGNTEQNVISGTIEYALISGKEHRIWDEHLTASSSYGRKPLSYPYCSRLLTTVYLNCERFGWSAYQNDNSWVQARFFKLWRVVRIATRGRKKEYAQWVCTFKLGSIGVENKITWYKRNNSTVMIFAGNTKMDEIVENALDPALLAHTVRLHVIEYHKWASLSWELYGRDI